MEARTVPTIVAETKLAAPKRGANDSPPKTIAAPRIPPVQIHGGAAKAVRHVGMGAPTKTIVVNRVKVATVVLVTAPHKACPKYDPALALMPACKVGKLPKSRAVKIKTIVSVVMQNLNPKNSDKQALDAVNRK
jgi:hypothetical protein